MKVVNFVCDTCQKSSESKKKPAKWIHVDYVDILDPESFDYPIIVKNGIAGHYCSQNCLLTKLAL